MSDSGKKIAKSNLFKVNLLIHKGEQIKLYVKLIRWMLSSGRYIIVFVEIIVISAFIYRYKLDAELDDLQEKIKEQIPYLQSLKNDETLIRQTQLKLSTVKQVRKESPDFAQTILDIAKITPKTIKLTTINLDRTQSFPKTNLLITGQTPSNVELSAFLKALKNNPKFTGINLTNISFEGQTVFTIVGSLNSQGGSS